MSENKVLFEITEDKVESGLRGVPAGYCPTSKVDPQLGLSYRGYYIDKLAYRDPEEVIYLLFYGELPTLDDLQKFKKRLASYKLSPEVTDHLRNLPKHGHPMKWFLSAVNILGMVQSKDNWEEDCFQVIALIPEVVAQIYRIRSGWGEPIKPDPNKGYMENFVHMLSLKKETEGLVELMRIFDVLHFDHGGGNLSTFTGKVIASGHADMYDSLVGAMAGLAGPLHGKANQECLSFVKRVHKSMEDPENEAELHKLLENMVAQKETIYGFGHAVLRAEDPRATIEYSLGDKLIPDNELFKLVKKLRKVGVEVLSKVEKVSNPYPNVDGVSGTLLNGMGLEDEDFYTVLFGMSRCVGIACQIYYERAQARGGKGTPIIRPKYLYSGPKR